VSISLDEPQLKPPTIVIKRRARKAAPAQHFRKPTEHRWVTWLTVLITGAAITGLALYLLLPTLESGYNGDDARNSQIPMIMDAHNQSYFGLVWENVRAWANASGRFFPMSIAETALIFLVFGTRSAYKMFQLGIVLADVVLLAIVVAKISRNVRVGLLAAFLAVLTFQLRQFFDPIMLFSGQQQIVVALLLLSVWATWSAMHTNRARATVCASAAWTTAMLTYETTYLLLPVFLLLVAVYGTSKRARIVNGLAYAVPTAILLGIVLVLRAGAHVESPSYTANYAIGDVSETFAKQFTSAIPLSYPSFGANYFPTTWSTGPMVSIILLSIVAAGILFTTLRKVSMTRRDGAMLFVTGMGMWVLPSLVVAITKGWQEQVNWGAGYVSEYVGYFGFAMSATVLVTGIAQVRNVLPKAINLALVLVLATGTGLLLGVTKQNNLATVESWEPFRYPRDVFERSVERGAFSGVLPGSSVISLQPGIWVDTAVVQGNGGPEIRKIDPPFRNASLPSCTSLNAQCFATHDPQWMTNHTGTKDGTGVSVVSRITSAIPSDSDRPVLLSNDIYLYVESPELQDGAKNASLQTVQQNGSRLDPITLDTNGATRIGNGPGWALWHFMGIPQVGVDRMTVNVEQTLAGALSPF
jgi:hypothetical protein